MRHLVPTHLLPAIPALLVVLLVVLLAAEGAPGQQPREPTTGGFLFAYAPTDRAAFDEGYRRHLEWHRAHGDSLSWFGWDVLVGDRPGVFVDGVFGVWELVEKARKNQLEGDARGLRTGRR